jgi:acetamidase/formamidase
MATHRIASTPETVRWGMFDAGFPALIEIASGDTVVLECVSGGPEVMPPPGTGFTIPPNLAAIHAAGIQRAPGHIITGPVGVRGAEPGDMLEVRIGTIEPGCDWGYCGFRPLAGTIPEDFPETFLSHIPVDRDRRTCRLPWGTELSLAPFFGVMGVAPPPMAGFRPCSRASMAATWTTRNSARGRRCSCRSGRRPRCSRPATAMACRATARSASTRWKSA